VPYLIDGNNVLHTAPTDGPMRSIGRDVLCRMVAQWARDRAVADVTIVFDGPTPRGDLARQIEQPNLTVRFSESRTADAVIEDLIARAKAPGRLTIVTTDRAIQHTARYRRCKCIDAGPFLIELCSVPQPTEPHAPAPPEKPNEPSRGETQEWLDEFGPDLPEATDDTEMWD